jgi:hypothetical protein
MTRRIFGWDLPPGCTHQHIEDALGVDVPCECCGHHVDDCICPECPTCGETGNPKCYKTTDIDHGINAMEYSLQQQIGQQELRVAAAKEQLQEEALTLEYLKSQAENNNGE